MEFLLVGKSRLVIGSIIKSWKRYCRALAWISIHCERTVMVEKMDGIGSLLKLDMTKTETLLQECILVTRMKMVPLVLQENQILKNRYIRNN